MKNFLLKLTPPFLLSWLKWVKYRKYGWIGNYANWQEAQIRSVGYDTEEILGTVRDSLLKVKNGEAIYERDSVVFDQIQYSWPLLAGLLFCSVKLEGHLKILDVGGSLGTTYFQNKKFLDHLKSVSWNIVEPKKIR